MTLDSQVQQEVQALMVALEEMEFQDFRGLRETRVALPSKVNVAQQVNLASLDFQVIEVPWVLLALVHLVPLVRKVFKEFLVDQEHLELQVLKDPLAKQ